MQVKQKTINHPIAFSGQGLHTGLKVNMELHPAPENHGVRFQRTDMAGAPVIEATADFVTATQRGTTLQSGDIVISTIEHILSALYGLGADNVLVKIDGPEVPILDGSARQYSEDLLRCGLREQEADRRYFTPKKKVYYKDEASGAEITIIPDNEFTIDLTIDFNSKIIGCQNTSYGPQTDYNLDIAPSRTFVFLHEILPLLKSNLIKGGDLQNAIVIVENPINKEDIKKITKEFGITEVENIGTGYLNHLQLRYPNECARHKLLDVIGDFSLVGFPMKAKIIANKPGHKINTILAKILRNEAMENIKNEIPVFDQNKEPIIDINGIKKLLPHRPPFLMVDRIIELTSDKIVGIKNIGINEGYFIGHFPDEPVMPGVLIIEAMAQVGGILVLNGLDEPERYSTYFAKIDGVKFRRKVVPGDVLVIKMVIITPLRRSIVCMRGEAYVGDKLACEGDLIAQVVKNK
ncbi:MAG: bifunctional UDP-3-O-[3-hydroxymyristoyl] N-acetylglucosamine deacetylase/3-hydroxyacyl-ACP dehydratase [Bacteroidales bacterium]|jgi:UDP-3-O-[3-hydroxymyristoyl] N-acetylglucosamine deacetylase/3-hydroxyacyl-[acyl-carrier-protein] dehydratase